jgi:tRNA threonylcarbamoyladenosine biosynthesis protein TsaE
MKTDSTENTIEITNLKQTINHAQSIAEKIKSPGLVFLNGDLGVGKTEWVRAFARSWFKDPKLIITSPTYSLLNIYEKGSRKLIHMDLYRLNSLDDLESTGFWDFLNEKNIICVEWSEKLLKDKISREYFDIHMKMDGVDEKATRFLTCQFHVKR